MTLTVVAGGQYGSEGKGKVCSHLAHVDRVDFMVRCGGPNSGHTVDSGGRRHVLRQVPAGVLCPQTRLLIAAGALIDVDVLVGEIELFRIGPERLGIDRNAFIIEAADRESERQSGLRDSCGSTLSGMGSAVSRRVMRGKGARTAKGVPGLQAFFSDVSQELGYAVQKGESVVVEGTQGFGLSLYHTPCYPFATSRDTTAGSFLGEVGLGPTCVDRVFMAVRTYPIRVAGNSGPMGREITWEEVQRRSGYPYPIAEFTSVTGNLRRVAEFDLELVRRAARANGATEIALHGADYLSYKNRGVTSYEELTDNAKRFIEDLEQSLGIPVSLIGTGPTNEEIIDRRVQRLQMGLCSPTVTRSA